MRLEGKVALITGAGRGIGKGIALAFARDGCAIAAVARTAEEVEATAQEVRGLGVDALALTCDVTRQEQVEDTVGTALEAFGHIDILVNNAGYAHFEPIKDLSPAQWQQTLDINLTGPFRCIKAVLPSMIERRAGRIINISSVAGLKPYIEQGAYGASKSGLNMLSQVLAMELRDYGIAVHAVCPGGVPTRLSREAMPHRDRSGWMTPEDIAHTCLYLATLSPQATTDLIKVRRFASTP